MPTPAGQKRKLVVSKAEMARVAKIKSLAKVFSALTDEEISALLANKELMEMCHDC